MPSWTIFKNIHHPPTAKNITNGKPINSIMPDAQKETIGTQDSKENQREQKDTNGISDNKNTNKGERMIRSRYGRKVKRPDRLMY